MLHFLRRHWFLLALLAILYVGVSQAERLEWLTDLSTARNLIVAGVLFVTTLPVDLSTLRNTLARPGPALLATCIAFGLIPLLSWPASRLVTDELRTGIMVLAVAPATLATAAVFTRRAGGNDLVPIMTTVITNLSCFFVAPLWLWVTAPELTETGLSLGDTIRKLFALVVLPMVVAQFVRQARQAASWATRHKHALSTVAQFGILAIVLIGAIQCGLRLRAEAWSLSAGGSQLGRVLAIVSAIHLASLWAGWQGSRWCGFAPAEAIGVAFGGSQKTLMVGLQLALLAGGGLTILPLFMYHFFQLIVATFVSERWAQSIGPPPPAGPG